MLPRDEIGTFAFLSKESASAFLEPELRRVLAETVEFEGLSAP